MGVYKLLELKALIIRLIFTFTSDKYVLNVAPQTIIPYCNLLFIKLFHSVIFHSVHIGI